MLLDSETGNSFKLSKTSSHQRCSIKIDNLKNFANSRENILAHFKKTLFTEHLRTTAADFKKLTLYGELSP